MTTTTETYKWDNMTFSPFELFAAPPAPAKEAKYLDHQSNLLPSC